MSGWTPIFSMPALFHTLDEMVAGIVRLTFFHNKKIISCNEGINLIIHMTQQKNCISASERY
jgi:hypothetical protein